MYPLMTAYLLYTQMLREALRLVPDRGGAIYFYDHAGPTIQNCPSPGLRGPRGPGDSGGGVCEGGAGGDGRRDGAGGAHRGGHGVGRELAGMQIGA